MHQNSGVEKLTGSGIGGFSNRPLISFISLEKGKFVSQMSLSETPFKSDRVSFQDPQKSCDMCSARKSMRCIFARRPPDYSSNLCPPERFAI